MLALAIAGNAVGGLGLVTILRLMQVPHKVAEARDDAGEGRVRGGAG